ncbi:MAG: hypothetical protein N4J56_002745 [Chroococcidiopsis sp. SAG 2025]|uniref:hypothetical protein n=1 Tax=Chroococcidiopsis sp. SAG 2025 TaxID=171389 RepID=UPI0029370FD8|nr:hypothetical protein [Chroococcidiopsis sp. SAG 2025]MDV2993091.1 hypothetical protein [Chroococcidiopsis sp. SAG 2025]
MPNSTIPTKNFQVCLGLTTIIFAVAALPQTVVAAEFENRQTAVKQQESREQKTELQAQNHRRDLSHNASDLQPRSEPTLAEKNMEAQLLAQEIDLNTFCRNYPYNSRCTNQNPTPEREQKQLETPAAESKTSGFALSAKASTLGFGIEGTGAISPNFNGRLGFNYFDFSIDTEKSDIDYDADIQLLSATALIDWFPSSRSEFRITGGIAYNDNKVDATARSAATLDIGGVEFPAAAVGQLEGEATFPNTISPYIGIGYGNPVKRDRRFTFSIDLGVLFTGSPEVDLNATGPASSLLDVPLVGSVLNDAIEREEEDIEDDLDGLSIYPVLTLGISYQF